MLYTHIDQKQENIEYYTIFIVWMIWKLYYDLLDTTERISVNECVSRAFKVLEFVVFFLCLNRLRFIEVPDELFQNYVSTVVLMRYASILMLNYKSSVGIWDDRLNVEYIFIVSLSSLCCHCSHYNLQCWTSKIRTHTKHSTNDEILCFISLTQLSVVVLPVCFTINNGLTWIKHFFFCFIQDSFVWNAQSNWDEVELVVNFIGISHWAIMNNVLLNTKYFIPVFQRVK